MKILRFKCYYVFYNFVLFYFYKKLSISRDALLTIKRYADKVDVDLYGNQALHQILTEIKRETPAIVILNAHALNLTLNWLCNVMNFTGVHHRLIVIAFDRIAYDAVSRSWPQIKLLHWPLPQMDRRFTTGDGQYQMFQYFRANLCAYLAGIGRDFWMVQADTYWRKNLFEIVDPNQMLRMNADLLFDQEGSEGLLAEMIAGGNYFVKASRRSECFFKELSRQLENYYATDNNIMGALCATCYCGSKCTFIPYRIISNWRWHWSTKEYVPALLQFDGGSGSNAKFMKMRELGAGFLDLSFTTEHSQAKCHNRKTAAPEDAVPEWRLKAEGNDVTRIQKLIAFFHEICECLYRTFPEIGFILRAYIFPYYAYYIVF